MDNASTEVVTLRRQLEKSIANEVCKMKHESCGTLEGLLIAFRFIS